MTDWNELIDNAMCGFPSEEHYTALLSAILEVEKERDALKVQLAEAGKALTGLGYTPSVDEE